MMTGAMVLVLVLVVASDPLALWGGDGKGGEVVGMMGWEEAQAVVGQGGSRGPGGADGMG